MTCLVSVLPVAVLLLHLSLSHCLPRRDDVVRSLVTDGPAYRLNSTWKLSDAAVATIMPSFPSTKRPAVVTSTYHALGSDPVYLLNDPPALSLTQLFDSEKWVNMVLQLEDGVIVGHSNLMLVAGGFLVPGKTGALSLADLTDIEKVTVVEISTSKDGWFYHKALPVDINGDGRADILSARATVPSFPWEHKQGELVWFEQPESNPLQGPWVEHVLIAGPDVFFVFEDINGDGKEELIATQFFTTGEVVIYSCNETLWSQCNNDSISQVVVDSSEAPYFNIQYVDMNLDGLKDMLVTNNRPDNGSLFVYEQVASSGSLPTFKRHTLASGYKPIKSGTGKGAPGTATAFLPKTTDTPATSKPWIVMSGDDSGVVVLLQPVSQDSSSWEYTLTTLLTSTGTVGQLGVGDVDGDGWNELYVPYYAEGKVEMWSHAESLFH